MTFRQVLRGYLLEEALAWLLRNAGYRLLTDASQDPDELTTHRGALCVQGRGATHQVDVLGEFALTPAFSLPIRLFLEAKFYHTPCGLNVVRNAHGVIHDVNENFIHANGARPRRRYQYTYALFSASGFTLPAQDYALAQQISLIDLSGASFSWLLDAVSEAADRLDSARSRHRITKFPVSRMRRKLRTALGTPVVSGPGAGWEPDDEPMAMNAPMFSTEAAEVVADFAATFQGRESRELLLGFPAAPYILPLATDDPAGFLHYAREQPAHPISLRRTGTGQNAEWQVFPRYAPEAYRLTFNLPDRVEEWISENDEWQSKRTGIVKNDLLPHITVYRREYEAVRVYQLRFEPSEFHRQRS